MINFHCFRINDSQISLEYRRENSSRHNSECDSGYGRHLQGYSQNYYQRRQQQHRADIESIFDSVHNNGSLRSIHLARCRVHVSVYSKEYKGDGISYDSSLYHVFNVGKYIRTCHGRRQVGGIRQR